MYGSATTAAANDAASRLRLLPFAAGSCSLADPDVVDVQVVGKDRGLVGCSGPRSGSANGGVQHEVHRIGVHALAGRAGLRAVDVPRDLGRLDLEAEDMKARREIRPLEGALVNLGSGAAPARPEVVGLVDGRRGVAQHLHDVELGGGVARSFVHPQRGPHALALGDSLRSHAHVGEGRGGEIRQRHGGRVGGNGEVATRLVDE